LYTYLLSMYNKGGNETEKDDFSSKIEGVLSDERLALLLLLVDNEYGDSGKDELKKAIQQLGAHIRSQWVHTRREELKRMVRQAEVRGDADAITQYMQEFRMLE